MLHLEDHGRAPLAREILDSVFAGVGINGGLTAVHDATMTNGVMTIAYYPPAWLDGADADLEHIDVPEERIIHLLVQSIMEASQKQGLAFGTFPA